MHLIRTVLLVTLTSSLAITGHASAASTIDVSTTGNSLVGAWAGPPEVGGAEYLTAGGAASKAAESTASNASAHLQVSSTVPTSYVEMTGKARATAGTDSTSDATWIMSAGIDLDGLPLKVSWISSMFGLNANATVTNTPSLAGRGGRSAVPQTSSGSQFLHEGSFASNGGVSADEDNPVGSAMMRLNVFPVSTSLVVAGDFDGDGNINEMDIVFLQDAMSVAYDSTYDLNSDMSIDEADLDVLLGYKGTVIGDANLDGRVDTADSSVVGANWGYASVWSAGDFNRDGVTNLGDYSLMSANWGYGTGARSPIPEPGSLGIILGVASLMRRWRTK